MSNFKSGLLGLNVVLSDGRVGAIVYAKLVDTGYPPYVGVVTGTLRRGFHPPGAATQVDGNNDGRARYTITGPVIEVSITELRSVFFYGLGFDGLGNSRGDA